jgi:hypothetical protein
VLYQSRITVAEIIEIAKKIEVTRTIDTSMQAASYFAK